MLHKVWNAHNVTLATKLKFFNNTVVSVLIYGSKSRKRLKEVEKRVGRFETGCLRKIYYIRWSDHVSEDDIRRRTGGQPSVIIKRRRWGWYGHVLRMRPRRLPKQAFSWTPAGRGKVGRTKDTSKRTIARETREENLDQQNMTAPVEDKSA